MHEKETLMSLAKEAAQKHLDGSATLNEAITKIAKRRELNADQLDRVCQFANHAVHKELMEKSAYVEFDLASPDRIQDSLSTPKVAFYLPEIRPPAPEVDTRGTNAQGGEKTASSKNKEEREILDKIASRHQVSGLQGDEYQFFKAARQIFEEIPSLVEGQKIAMDEAREKLFQEVRSALLDEVPIERIAKDLAEEGRMGELKEIWPRLEAEYLVRTSHFDDAGPYSEQRRLKTASEDTCWEGYEQVGMKMKNGKKVPNCVPKGEAKKKKKQDKKAGVSRETYIDEVKSPGDAKFAHIDPSTYIFLSDGSNADDFHIHPDGPLMKAAGVMHEKTSEILAEIHTAGFLMKKIAHTIAGSVKEGSVRLDDDSVRAAHEALDAADGCREKLAGIPGMILRNVREKGKKKAFDGVGKHVGRRVATRATPKSKFKRKAVKAVGKGTKKVVGGAAKATGGALTRGGGAIMKGTKGIGDLLFKGTKGPGDKINRALSATFAVDSASTGIGKAVRDGTKAKSMVGV